jgi:hypothetical protein
MTRALLQQALEALETCVTIKHGGGLGPEQLFNVPVIESACKAIRAHLAQPQGAPVAYMAEDGRVALRDYFAARAMAAYLIADQGNTPEPEQTANDAYFMADAMLKARTE